MFTVNMVGCGRLGKTLGYLLNAHQLVTLQGICNPTLTSSQMAVNFIGAGTACEHLGELKPAEIYFITAPDDHIQSVCEQILQHHTPRPHSIFVHCSGLLKSDILASAKAAGHLTASFHPVTSFANPAVSITNFTGTFCTLEGDAEACTTLTTLFEPLRCHIIPFAKEGKAQYHAASVMASNYIVPLFYYAMELYIQAGIPAASAKAITIDSMQKALGNIHATTDIPAALTGPLNRGDVDTIVQHLAALEPHFATLYRTLGRYSLPLTPHDASRRQQLLAALYG